MAIELPMIEKSAGVILYRHFFDGRKYLVIRSSREQAEIAPQKFVQFFWDFPKGKIEYGETGEEAARREVGEETGVTEVDFMPGFMKNVHYTIYKGGKPIPKEVYLYLAQTSTERVVLSQEHRSFEWLSFDDAFRRVTLVEMKNALKDARKFLETI
ncbi:MAG: NUDIX hydrolase [Parcubacteria group bacterium Gr01-1014_48]|nr:MAG: NUDIX hydrolase [Parcubacteria group bacterium Greene0416_14]TSC73679.1 MAG: NUDIX hydrolase [Parcubacteria group bacterium Gr01-1014_48]TSD00259.1 MAG: NUDIX hydrolase [Parcubacteria group bacterium Greene1014_15]TSD06911.1 MAG: NUDIX hydrolase [Parcubacteria group bacterium Greene0714_4]